MDKSPRSIFLSRLWAFLNYRTTVGLTWLEILTASGVGLLVVWISLHEWAGLTTIGPLSVYLLLVGFYLEWRIPMGWLRALYYWLSKPLDVKPEPTKTYYALALFAVAIFVTVLSAFFDWRIAALLALTFVTAAILLWTIRDRETRGGTLNLHAVASRVPIREIKEGQVIHPDGTASRVSIITLGRSGFKPALQAADVADRLTKFLAHLAQREQGTASIKLFWLTDYHLGQLDLTERETGDQKYMQELRALAESGARKARLVLTGIVYPTQIETHVREWLAQLDFSLAPLGAFAAESLVRMLMGGESFLSEIQQVTLGRAGGLPNVAYRGYVPEQMSFGAQIKTNRNVLNVSRINTEFPDARDALMRALQSVDGLVTITLTPLPRSKTATGLRGRILAARVPGLGRPKEARAWREILAKLEDRRSLEYLFDTQTFFVTWGSTEQEAQKNQTLAMTYLNALEWTLLSGRALDSLGDWLPVLSAAQANGRLTRLLDWLALPPPPPYQQLLTTEAISTLANEEGSDIYLADASDRILLGRSVDIGKEGLRYVDFRSDTGPVLLVSDQGGGKTSTLIIWFVLRLQLLNYKIVAVNLKYSTRMQAAIEKIGGIVLHPDQDVQDFEIRAREAFFSNRAVIYQPVKGTRPFAIADDPCLRAFMKVFYEEWLPHRNDPAALVIDEIHRLMPKDNPLSANAAEVATLVAEAFKDWAERKLVIAAATQTLRDLLGSNLGIALQKFRTAAYFQVGPEDRDMLVDKGYEPALVEAIIAARRRPRGYCVLVMPDGYYTTIKILVTQDEREIIQRLDVEETSDTTPQLTFQ